jgi:hypothetical protein
VWCVYVCVRARACVFFFFCSFPCVLFFLLRAARTRLCFDQVCATHLMCELDFDQVCATHLMCELDFDVWLLAFVSLQKSLRKQCAEEQTALWRTHLTWSGSSRQPKKPRCGLACTSTAACQRTWFRSATLMTFNSWPRCTVVVNSDRTTAVTATSSLEPLQSVFTTGCQSV